MEDQKCRHGYYDSGVIVAHCFLVRGHDGPHLYKCASTHCPGLPEPGSVLAHPASCRQPSAQVKAAPTTSVSRGRSTVSRVVESVEVGFSAAPEGFEGTGFLGLPLVENGRSFLHSIAIDGPWIGDATFEMTIGNPPTRLVSPNTPCRLFSAIKSDASRFIGHEYSPGQSVVGVVLTIRGNKLYARPFPSQMFVSCICELERR